MKKLALLLVLGLAVSAQAGIVPNGDFETILKPDTAITGVLSPAGNAWSMGVGPDCPIDMAGTYEFADATSSTIADIPGWVGYDPQTWRDLGGTYNRPQESGNNQGCVQNQTVYSGLNAYAANGGDWGNAAGGLIVSDAPLGRPGAGPYTAAMMVKGNAGPYTLEVLVNGAIIAPDAAVTPPVGTADWTQMSKTYNTLPAGNITLVVGVGRNATGGQSQMDDVSFIPEPATMTILGLGGLALLRRRK